MKDFEGFHSVLEKKEGTHPEDEPFGRMRVKSKALAEEYLNMRRFEYSGDNYQVVTSKEHGVYEVQYEEDSTISTAYEISVVRIPKKVG